MSNPKKLNVINTGEVLSRLNVDYVSVCSGGEEPESIDLTFSDLIPGFSRGIGRALRISGERLYRHQYEALLELRSGNNVVLVSGTGSGKTEVWTTYSLMSGVKVLAIYPTLALASDQIERIKDYYTSVVGGDYVVEVDRPVVSELGEERVAALLSKALVVITNPAFLMNEVKRLAVRPSAILLKFLRDTDLIVLDEFDFYGSKGASLLLGLVSILTSYICRKRPQVAVLTATLGNPDDVKSILTDINGRDTKVVYGRAFSVPNCTYIVYGRNLSSVREYILSSVNVNELPQEVRDLIENPDLFNRYAYSIVSYLRELGYSVPDPHFDVTELLTNYVRDEGVTVVFTSSIRTAERLASRLRERVGDGLKELIATHHHLIPKNVRKRIEDAARDWPPRVKVIITVRTLLQGIDIDNIVRVVHYGLPSEVREFKQREGRKGRRRYIPYSESVIVPVTSWDYSILTLGVEGIKEYLTIPLEKVYVSRGNKYVKLFTSLFKVLRNIPLEGDELELLKSLNLVEEAPSLTGKAVRLNESGLEVWKYLNFYEYGPPYGIPRVVLGDGEKYAEEVSRRDFIESFQPGSIDYSEEAIVAEVSRRYVKEVGLRALSRYVDSYPFLRDAVEGYKLVKRRWGEVPNIVSDVMRGKLSSVTSTVITIPKSGFGLYVERPYDVKWYVESNKIRFRRVNNTVVAYYDEATVALSGRVYGEYRDFTYGFIRYADPGDDVDDLVVGLAGLKLILRLSERYSLSFKEVMFDANAAYVKSIPVIYVWEPEAAGILELIRWGDVREKLSKFHEPPKLWLQLIKCVDRRAYTAILNKGYGWHEVLSLINKVLNYLENVIHVKLKGLGTLTIPKPSRELKILSIDVMDLNIRGVRHVIIAVFDGESFSTTQTVAEGGEVRDVDSYLFKLFSEALDGELTITSGINLSNYVLSNKTRALYNALIANGRVVNALEIFREALKIPYVDLKYVSDVLGVRDSPDPAALTGLISREVARGVRPLTSLNYAKSIAMWRSELYYLMYLVVKSLAGTK